MLTIFRLDARIDIARTSTGCAGCFKMQLYLLLTFRVLNTCGVVMKPEEFSSTMVPRYDVSLRKRLLATLTFEERGSLLYH